ncbi:MAG: hypothetical protein CUN55_15515 [Phototrophicales bacterium]|nr:MAG: hypothetical protein CUN55_15515 [Phototrophicales bacterium]
MDNRILTVGISIILIIAIAILSEYSKTIAAITTTMPTKIPIAIWLIWVSEQGNRQAMVQFNQDMMISLIPTIIFLLATWWAARMGWSLIPMIASGYVAWGSSLGLAFLIGKMF